MASHPAASSASRTAGDVQVSGGGQGGGAGGDPGGLDQRPARIENLAHSRGTGAAAGVAGVVVVAGAGVVAIGLPSFRTVCIVTRLP